MSEPRRWAIVPAAGIGKRMASQIPKQYLSLNERAVIDHAIERLLLHPAIDGVYVAVADADVRWAATEFAGHPDLVSVAGGAERCFSVLNALEKLQQRADPEDWVLVHDAARPCVRREDIDRLITRVSDHAVGGLLGLPVNDTMKRTNAAGSIESTVERKYLWHAYTPQMFRVGLLAAALQEALAAGFLVTDEASAIEFAGHQPVMVEGHADNLKITRPDDLALASHFLARQAGEAAGLS